MGPYGALWDLFKPLINNDLGASFVEVSCYSTKMTDKFHPEDEFAVKVQSEQPDKLVSIKKIMGAADLSDRTVKRLAEANNWEVKRFNSRLVRYLKSDVEKTLGIKL